MTPSEELAIYGATVLGWDWDMRHEDHAFQHIPLTDIVRTPDGQHISHEQYRQERACLQPHEFYATRVIGSAVIKKFCSLFDVSEYHGFVLNPHDCQRIGFTMLLIKDDDPCSNVELARHLEDAGRVIGWAKDEEGIMRPVYRRN